MLKISHISKTFNPGTVNKKKAITDLSLELKKGDFATIIDVYKRQRQKK